MSHAFSVNAWFAAISSHDFTQLRPFLRPNSRYEDIPTATVSEGLEAIAAFFERVWTAFPDMEMRPECSVSDSGTVAAEWIMTGTHLGDFPGLPSTGNRLRIRGASMLVLAGGRVRRVTDYWDLLSSGLLPALAGHAEPEQDLAQRA
jgi:steroid delta-isomerase-like uncharacterized protein